MKGEVRGQKVFFAQRLPGFFFLPIVISVFLFLEEIYGFECYENTMLVSKGGGRSGFRWTVTL